MRETKMRPLIKASKSKKKRRGFQPGHTINNRLARAREMYEVRAARRKVKDKAARLLKAQEKHMSGAIFVKDKTTGSLIRKSKRVNGRCSLEKLRLKK